MKSLRSNNTNPRSIGTNPRAVSKLSGGTIGGGCTKNSKKILAYRKEHLLTKMAQQKTLSHSKLKKHSGWKPKRFPRLKTDRHLLNSASEILRATWNKTASEKRGNGFRGDVYKQKSKNIGEKAKHYFPILADTLIQEGIQLSMYIKIMSNYGFYGKLKIMPDPGWLIKQKAIESFSWMLEKEMKMHPGKNWEPHIASIEGKPFDRNPSEHEIEREVRHSHKHLGKFLKINPIELGCAAVFEWDKLSPWFLALCKPFLELQGLDIVNREMRSQIVAAKRQYHTDPKIKKRIRASSVYLK